jgi:hypothetical protein
MKIEALEIREYIAEQVRKGTLFLFLRGKRKNFVSSSTSLYPSCFLVSYCPRLKLSSVCIIAPVPVDTAVSE